MPIQFLRETVVTEATDRVSVGVTAEELAKYPRLLVFAKLSRTSTSSNETELVFNYGNTGTYDYSYVSTGADTNQAYIPGWSWDHCSCWVDVYGAANGYACAYMRGSLSSNNMYGGRIGVFGFSKLILYDDITTIDFIAKPGTTGNIATMGSAMRLYGCTYGIK